MMTDVVLTNFDTDAVVAFGEVVLERMAVLKHGNPALYPPHRIALIRQKNTTVPNYFIGTFYSDINLSEMARYSKIEFKYIVRYISNNEAIEEFNNYKGESLNGSPVYPVSAIIE